MTINIRTNVASLTAQRNLGSSTGSINSAYERLSSGLRINHARDDAAGLSIAESLKADAKVASVGIRNANDGISIISISELLFILKEIFPLTSWAGEYSPLADVNIQLIILLETVYVPCM